MEKGEELANHFKEGDKVTSVIISMNADERKIGLSKRRLRKAEEEKELKEFSKDSEDKVTLGDVFKQALSTEDVPEEKEEETQAEPQAEE